MVKEVQSEYRLCEKIKPKNTYICLEKDTSVPEPTVNLRLEVVALFGRIREEKRNQTNPNNFIQRANVSA